MMMMEPYFSQMDKIIDGLYLGDIQGASNIVQLKKKGITHILQVAAGFQPFFPGEFQYMVVNVLDMPHENLMRHFKPAVDFIKSAIRQGGTVLVHCFAGVSRSASVVIAYLMKELGLPMLDALTYTRKRRPIVFPNPGFQKQLFEFEKHLRANNQRTMIEYQEKKKKKIIEQHNQLTQQSKQMRATASFDATTKASTKQQTFESAKVAYQMYESNKSAKPSAFNERANATVKLPQQQRHYTQTKPSESVSPQGRPLTQNQEKRQRTKEMAATLMGAFNDKTPKQNTNSQQARNFDLSVNQDLRVKKILSSTENSPQRSADLRQQSEQMREAKKIKQQMSHTQAGQILGFQGHVNLESSYKRDYAVKPLELAISMNQKKTAISNTPTRIRETGPRNSKDDLVLNAPHQLRSTTLIQGNDSKDKNQASHTQQYFYQKEKQGRYSDAAVLIDQKKPPLMMIQKTLPKDQVQSRGGSTTLQADARRLAALGALPNSYFKAENSLSYLQHNNIPMHPKLIDGTRKGETILTPPPNGGKQHQYSSSLNNSAGKEATQKLILQEKGGFTLKQMPPQNASGLSSFDNRNLRDAATRKRY